MKLAILTIALVLSACGQPQSDPQQNFDEITLDVVTSFDKADGNRKTYEDVITGFENETGIVINDDSSKSDENWKKQIVDRFESGNIPDVLFFFKNAPEITGKAVSLDVIRESFPNYAESVSAAVLNDMKEKDGKVYAIPVTGFWEGMFINKSLFTDNNIEIPTDYEMLLTAIERFRELSIVPIAASISQEPHYLFEFLTYNRSGPAGHKTVVTNTSDTAFTHWEEGLTDFRRLYEMGAFQEDLGLTHLEALDLFQQKKAAMFVDGSWRVGSITDTDDVIVIPFPGSTVRKSTDLLGGFSMGFYITQTAWDNKRDAAVAFVDAMIDKTAIAGFNANGAASPVPSIEAVGDTNLLNSIIEMTKDATAFVPAVQDSFTPEARESLFSDIEKITLGEMSPREALEQFITLNGQSVTP